MAAGHVFCFPPLSLSTSKQATVRRGPESISGQFLRHPRAACKNQHATFVGGVVMSTPDKKRRYLPWTTKFVKTLNK